MCSVGGPIGPPEMKLISQYALLGPVTILLLTALAAVTAWGLAGLSPVAWLADRSYQA